MHISSYLAIKYFSVGISLCAGGVDCGGVVVGDAPSVQDTSAISIVMSTRVRDISFFIFVLLPNLILNLLLVEDPEVIVFKGGCDGFRVFGGLTIGEDSEGYAFVVFGYIGNSEFALKLHKVVSKTFCFLSYS